MSLINTYYYILLHTTTYSHSTTNSPIYNIRSAKMGERHFLLHAKLDFALEPNYQYQLLPENFRPYSPWAYLGEQGKVLHGNTAQQIPVQAPRPLFSACISTWICAGMQQQTLSHGCSPGELPGSCNRLSYTQDQRRYFWHLRCNTKGTIFTAILTTALSNTLSSLEDSCASGSQRSHQAPLGAFNDRVMQAALQLWQQLLHVFSTGTAADGSLHHEVGLAVAAQRPHVACKQQLYQAGAHGAPSREEHDLCGVAVSTGLEEGGWRRGDW